MPQPPAPRGFLEIQSAETGRAYGRVMASRVAALPVATAVAMTVFLLDPSIWRRIYFVLALGAATFFFLWERRRFEREGFRPGGIALNIGSGVFGILLGAFATGGLESPVIPIVLPIAMINGIFLRRQPTVGPAKRLISLGFLPCGSPDRTSQSG